jgi:2-haloalkanoic acid dehalogenase type II
MNDLWSVEALTFDCYGTLVDWEQGILSVLRPWARGASVSAHDDALLQAFARAEPACQREMPGALYPEILRAVFGRIAAAFERPADPGIAAALASSVGTWPPFPDAPAALRRLGEQHRLVVVSNVDKASFARTQRQLGIEFDAVITAEEVGAWKPDPRMFLRALDVIEGMGVPRKDVVHVAQSLYHDHAPAQALGLRTVWVDRRRGKSSQGATPPAPAGVQPTWTVPSLSELAALFA